MTTRIRLFEGERWRGATVAADIVVDVLPAIGQRLAIAGDGGWRVGTVIDVAHRIVDPAEAADIALLVSPLTNGGSLDEPLPLAALDGEVLPSIPQASSSVKRGPWE